MTALDLLFLMGQVLTLMSLVYFLGLVLWWRWRGAGALETSELARERQGGQPQSIWPENTGETAALRHREIALAGRELLHDAQPPVVRAHVPESPG